MWPCVKIFLYKNSVSVSLEAAALASVRAGYVELIAGQFSESETENISASDSYSESPRPPWFSWLVKIWADFSSAQNTQLLDGFFRTVELLALAGVDSLVLVGQKRDRGIKLGCPLCCAGVFALCLWAHHCRTVFFIWSLEIGLVPFRMGYRTPTNVTRFPEGFLQMLWRFICLSKSGVGSEITGNGLLSGCARRKRSLATLRWISLMNFC